MGYLIMKSSKLRIVVEFVYPFLYILFVFGSRFVSLNLHFLSIDQSMNFYFRLCIDVPNVCKY